MAKATSVAPRSRFSQCLRHNETSRSGTVEFNDKTFGTITQSVRAKGNAAKRGIVALAAVAQAQGGSLTESYTEIIGQGMNARKCQHSASRKISGQEAYGAFLDVGIPDSDEVPAADADRAEFEEAQKS